MRIGIDYFPAATHAPGLGRYARELTRALVALDLEHELRLLEFGRAPLVMGEAALGLRPDTYRRTLRWPARALPWLARLGLAADRLLGGVDVFQQIRLHGPPVARARQVLGVSDWCGPGGEAALRRRLLEMDHYLVFCGEYRGRVLELTGVDEARVHRVPVGADHWLRDLARLPTSVEKPDPPRVLVLGAALPGREHLAILRACELLDRKGRALQLCFAGARTVGWAEVCSAIEASSLGQRVAWRVPEERQLPELVASSSLLVHLNVDEGTAVTPMEALVLGVPVLVSPLPAFRESLGDAASYFEGGGDRELADHIAAGLDATLDESRRAALAERYTWRNNALATVAAWETIS